MSLYNCLNYFSSLESFLSSFYYKANRSHNQLGYDRLGPLKPLIVLHAQLPHRINPITR